ncbi:leucine-rich repeat protein [Enterocytozoon bieneusi H348]|nr:leucine-rich repeat protein [Enterocytozoon bieneusi H348]|eukprot:XP_002650261.1 leucine-rich repeat protein [Enterocytozoon bieneusi H348]
MHNSLIEIAKANKSIPEIYRKLNIEDHLYNYELKHEDSQLDIILNIELEKFNNNLQYFIQKKSLDEINFTRLKNMKNMIDKEYQLSKIIKTHKETTSIAIDQNSLEKHIYMCRSYITSLTDNIGLINKTQVLQACCNYITQIPYSIKHLKNLKMLILSRNRIKELPEELGCCTELRELDLSNNLITSIPNSIASLKSLTILHLSNNKLKHLNSALGKLNSLKNLYVNNNEIEYLPLEIFKLPFLTQIAAEGNPLKVLDKSKIIQIREMTLLEECARNIIRNNSPIPFNLHKMLKNYLLNVKECSFCSGPFFVHYYTVQAMHEFDGKMYPVSYSLCSQHYNDHSERIKTLFSSSTMYNMPIKLQKSTLLSITEIFEPFCYSEEILEQINNDFDQSYTTKVMPLMCLSLYNSKFFKKFVQEKKKTICCVSDVLKKQKTKRYEFY